MTTFHRAKIGTTTVASGYTAGAGSLVVADGSQFGSTFPLLVIAVRAGVRMSVLEVTARSTNTLTISGAVDGTSDVNLLVGDVVKEGPAALHVNELQDAVNTNDAAAVHVTGTETIGGAKTFTTTITVASGSDTANVSADAGAGPEVGAKTTNSGHGAYMSMYGGYEAWLNFKNLSNSSGTKFCRYGAGHTSNSFQLDLLTDDGSAIATAAIFSIHLATPAGTFKIDWSGSAATIGVFGATPVVKPTVTGSRGGNAALASFLTAMANLGWIADSSS